MTDTGRTRLTEADFIERLKAKYGGEEWAFFRQVPSGTGGHRATTADGVAINLWPSRGLSIIGFEIKSHRNDFLGELKNPAKAETIQQFCDHWFLVAEKDVVKDGELPPTWGLMVPHGKGLKVVKEAPTLTPVTLTKAFVAGLARAIKRHEETPEEIEAIKKAAREEGRRHAEERLRWRIESEEREKNELLRKIQRFEEISGLVMSRYEGPKIAEAVKVMQQSDELEGIISSLEFQMQGAAEFQEIAQKAIEQMRAFKEKDK
jgi:hypothetical protein